VLFGGIRQHVRKSHARLRGPCSRSLEASSSDSWRIAEPGWRSNHSRYTSNQGISYSGAIGDGSVLRIVP
jgi:hypothetical protein